MKKLNLSTIEEIITNLERDAALSGYRLKTKIVEPPRIILDVVAVLQFSNVFETVTISLLGEYDDDFVMIIMFKDEDLQTRTTMFRTLDNLTGEEFFPRLMAA